MTKLAIIVGGVVLMAGVALAGTLTSLGASNNPPGQAIAPVSSTTGTVSDDRGLSVESEPAETAETQNEDLRGPCDEAEHVNEARCAGAVSARGDDHRGNDDRSGRDDRGRDDHGRDDGGHQGRGHDGEDD